MRPNNLSMRPAGPRLAYRTHFQHPAPVGTSSAARIACIGDNTLAAYAEGRLDAQGRGPVEAHLVECLDCRTVLGRAAPLASGVERSSASTANHPVEDSSGYGGRGVDEDAEELSPGARVSRYVVERIVGRGAMGAVYAARDPDLDRTVAIKLLRADALREEERQRMRGRLLREAQAMARLSHPEVITVYDVGALGSQLFVAMEYVDGGTLRQWRNARSRNVAEILTTYARAGSGLAAAHEAGLVHRDFKPDNVLVGRDDRVRVTDFGLARSVFDSDMAALASVPESVPSDRTPDSALAMTLTRTGTLLGTPAYMAPEQLRGLAADARSDVFSFCVALYEALYGERPFAGATVPALRDQIDRCMVRAPPPKARVPGSVRAILMRGLSAAPHRRFASMRVLLDALRKEQAKSRRRAVRGVSFAALGIVGLLGATRLSVRPTPRTPDQVVDSLARAAGRLTIPASAEPAREEMTARLAAAVTADRSAAVASSTASTPTVDGSPAAASSTRSGNVSRPAPALTPIAPPTHAPLSASAESPGPRHLANAVVGAAAAPAFGENGAPILPPSVLFTAPPNGAHRPAKPAVAVMGDNNAPILPAGLP